jgi:hypothetical protein
MAKSKGPKFDTSFHFGANVKPKPAGGKPRRRRRGGTTSARSRRYFAGLHGS